MVYVQIAPEQLTDMSIPWVILGHSERRSLLEESNDFVGAKAANALTHGLKVIACIGETLEQRESGQVQIFGEAYDTSWGKTLRMQQMVCRDSMPDIHQPC